MRFRGGRIGHKALRPIENLLDGANVKSPEDASNDTAAAATDDTPQSEDEEEEEDSGDEGDALGLDEDFLGPEDGEDQEEIEENPSY